MPNRYASEVEAPRIFQIQRELFERLGTAIGAAAVEAASVLSEPVLPFREGVACSSARPRGGRR